MDKEKVKKLYREAIMSKIEEDEELRKLYLQDCLFKNSVMAGIIQGWDYEKIMMTALKIGYKVKEETFQTYSDHMIRCCDMVFKNIISKGDFE